ncbi:dixin-like [Daphnia carinata]|uniref:dixin-like n=1 Tax=Daphnia carinata TaxID=120202 RepID=UPI00257E161F|nr:dixin-like [Daphnia carinata]
MGSMFKWKVSSLGSRSNGNSSGGSKKADKHLNNNAPPPATTQQPPPPTDKNKTSDSRDNCPPPQKAIQQPQPQQPVPPPFSPILARSADDFSPRQHLSLVQQPHQQQQQQQQQHNLQQQQQLQQTQPKSIGHHYRPAPPAEPQYHQHGAADGSQSWNEWNQQLLAYTAWVNSQLRKRPELPLIDDMGNDLQDGVLVAKLIEIITGKDIRGIDVNAKTQQAKRDNFEKILTFLASQRVRTSTVTSRDLATGNLKSLMRLILSLASHYKPHSVKQGRDSASFRANSQTTPNLNVPTNRRFQTTGFEPQEADMKTVNALATLRRQNTSSGATAIRPALATSSSAADLLSPGVQRRYTMNGSTINREIASQLSQFGTISNARSLANLQHHKHDDSLIESPRQHAAMATSTSVGDLNTSEEDATVRKPILKKDSKYGSRRELPALGVSGVVSKGRPSIFEFWENMLGPNQPDQTSSMTIAPGESSDVNENNSGSRASMRRVLPPLPGQPQSLTVSTTPNNNGPSAELLGSRGEVEGSSNQPSPTCVTGEIDPGYWSAVRSNNSNHDEMNTTTVKASHHDLLIDDLNRTKKQLAELQNMLLTSQQEATMTESKGTTTTSSTDPDAISWLRSTLHSVDQRCTNLQSDLKKAQQDCLTLDGSRRGLAACLANQEEALGSLRQELVRTTLANQTMTNEKVEMQRKLEEKDRQIADLRRQLAAKDRVMETQRAVLEEASHNFTPALRAKLDKNISTMDARRNQYREELHVAREALSSLRSNFRGNDPNHHTLDTLEQCMAFLLERIAGPDTLDMTSSSTSQSTLIHRHSNDTLKRSNLNGYHADQFTKVVYFTERTVTPFLTVIPRRLGEISLRDFKTLFDRPGVYRFHFKAQDAEYGFVKEEIADDNMILPGFDGKIIAWVEEIQV